MQSKTLSYLLLLLAAAFGLLLQGSFNSGCAASEDEVVATVNGVHITKSQLDWAIMEYKNKSKKIKVTPNDKLELLKGLIRRNLILQQPAAEELRKDQTIVRQIKEMENQLVIAAYLDRQVGRHSTVKDEEMKEYYKKNLNKFATPPKVRASHILLRNKEEALLVMDKLRAGQEFGQLAKQYSIDLPMALKGGSMGIIAKGKTLPDLEKALFLLKEGQFSDIVETKFGYHILTVDEIMTDKYQSYDEAKGQIRKILMLQKEGKAFEEMVAKLEKNADIKILDVQLLKAVVEQPPSNPPLSKADIQ